MRSWLTEKDRRRRAGSKGRLGLACALVLTPTLIPSAAGGEPQTPSAVSTHQENDTAVRPFEIAVDQAVLGDLRERLTSARFPDWSYPVSVDS